MKKFLLTLVLVFGLSMLTNVQAQDTGEVGGYDSERTTFYNNVRIYNGNNTLTGKAVFTYDTKYSCWNNIKFINYQDASGYVRLIVYVGGYKYVDKKVWLQKGRHTYLDDVFKHCYSSKKSLKVQIRAW